MTTTIEVCLNLSCAFGLAVLVGSLDQRTSVPVRLSIGVLSLLEFLAAGVTIESPQNSHYVNGGVTFVLNAVAAMVIVTQFTQAGASSAKIAFWRKVLPYAIVSALIAATIFGYSLRAHLR